MHKPDWDDYRFILAVAEQGTLAAAADRLGVNHTTVLRRLSHFEKAHEVKLFTRSSAGHVPTIEGEAVIAIAREMSEKLSDLQQNLIGDAIALEGMVSVTTTESILTGALARHLRGFCEKNPMIHIDLSITSARLDLTRRDADVAVRPALRRPDGLVARRVSGLGFAVYGSAEMAKADCARPLTEQIWVGLGSVLRGAPAVQWLRKTIPEAQIAMSADTFGSVRDCISAGVGVGVLPCCIGDECAGLQRLCDPIRDLETSIWVLNHKDLQSSARVTAFVDYITTGIEADAALLEGTA